MIALVKDKVKDERHSPATDDAPLFEALLQGSRRALARAITLSESQCAEQRTRARTMLRALQERAVVPTSHATRRIGITGAPGAGKSTLIAALCECLLRRQEGSLAVLASDPSGVAGGGAVLADKTRMGALVAEQRIFIRPSAAGAGRTLTTGLLESLLFCEACGYETLLVESVGAGQAETAIDDYVDCLLLLLAPGSGDGLQGMKRGLVELVDILVVTKADGALATQARQTLEDYRHAVGGVSARNARATQYLVCSAQDGEQVEALCAQLDAFFRKRSAQALRQRRALQRKNLFLRAFAEGAIDYVLREAATPKLRTRFREILRRLEDPAADGGSGNDAFLPAELADGWLEALDFEKEGKEEKKKKKAP